MKSNISPARSAAVTGRSSYVETLNAAWSDHLEPKADGAPTVVSLFAGCGGSSLGYSMAGYRELLAVEWDDNAVETFRLNFPDVPVYHGDIHALSNAAVLEMTGLEPGELDVLDGSPPCQGFSTAGKRILDDPRNSLFREYVRILTVLRPKALVMENVSGMVKGKMKLVFAESLQELKSVGYRVSVRLMNAMYFRVPQSRQRLIFIGTRNDLDVEPSHPKAQHQPTPWYPIPDSAGADKWLGEHRYRGCLLHKARQAAKGNSFHSIFVKAGRPFPTIPKSMSGAGGIYIQKGTDIRYPTIAELKSASSYPVAFRLIGSSADQWARIGNSVPPLFMRAIARHVDSVLSGRCN